MIYITSARHRQSAVPFICLLAVMWFSLTGCASYTDHMAEVRDAYTSGKYATAEEKIKNPDLSESENLRLLFLLELGMIRDRLDKFKDSRNCLMDADKLADQLYTTSISKEALTYIYNESAQAYSGEDYEKVAIHTILALSFLETGDRKAARVEARKINTKLDEINSRYEEKKNRYGRDAFALLMSASIYESEKEWDASIIDYRGAVEVYESVYTKELGVDLPELAVKSYAGALKRRNRTSDLTKLAEKFPNIVSSITKDPKKSQGPELMMIFETGTIAPKVAKEFVLPLGGQIIRFSFPIIYPNKHSDKRPVEVRVAGQSYNTTAELVQNMDKIAYATLEDRRARLMLKQGARLIGKAALTEAAYKNLGIVGGIAANVYSAASETADTRSWSLLPSAFYAARLELPPKVQGKQTIEVDSWSVGAKKNTVAEMVLQPDRLHLLRFK